MKQVWVVALLLVPLVFAAPTIETSETTIDLDVHTALIHNELTVVSPDIIGNLTLILAQDADNILITIDGKEKNCLVQAEFARCGSLDHGSHLVNISYETPYPIADVGENTIYRYTDLLPFPARTQEVVMKLPVGYIIPRERGKADSFYTSPTPTDVYSDGQRIILYWKQEGQELPISVVARNVIGLPVGWMVSTGILILLGTIAVVWFVLHTRKKPEEQPETTEEEETVVPTLIDNEQQVVEFLKKQGEVWQKQIQHATGFSKAKVSRVIRNLEARGVVTKTPYGNTNKIALKKEK